MSWDIMHENQEDCPCGNGKIVIHSLLNDWSSQKEELYIKCDFCNKNYKIYTEIYYKSDGEMRTINFLITKNFDYYKSLDEYLEFKSYQYYSYLIINKYNKENLFKFINILNEYKNINNIRKNFNDNCFLVFFKLSKKELKTQKFKIIIQCIELLLKNWEEYKSILDNEEENKKKWDTLFKKNSIKLKI